MEKDVITLSTKNEILKVGGEDLELFLEIYQIDLDDPSLDSQYHLRNLSYTEEIMSRFRINELELNKKKLDWERRFKIIQSEREFPMIDKKIITSWNGQMISGLIDAFEAFKMTNS